MVKKKCRVVHIGTGHDAYDTRILKKQCVSLNEVGYEVTFIVPSDRSFVVDGVSVTAIKPMSTRFMRILVAPWLALVAGLKAKALVYHLHDPNLLPVGLVLKLLGKKVIFDSHENYPADIKAKEWIPTYLRPFISWAYSALESFAVAKYNAVVAVTTATHIRFKELNENSFLIMNFPIIQKVVAAGDQSKSNHFVWCGMLSPIRSCYELDQAFGESQLQLDVIGTVIDFTPSTESINLLGTFDQSEAFSMAKDYLAAIVTYLPEPNSLDALPNKIFEYMALGLPVIASNFPHWVALVEEAGCGICVDPESVEDIKKALAWFSVNQVEANLMGERGRQEALNKYSWESEKIKLIGMYEEVLK